MRKIRMDEKDIRLADGTLFSVKVNFYTLYLINKTNVEQLSKKLERENKKEKKDKKRILDIEMEIAKNIIYVIMRSNGKKVDKEEAMMLTPVDPHEIEDLMNEFADKMEKLKKKEGMKM